MYLIERIILVSIWVISFISIWFIPKEQAAKASFIFLITQFFTWINGIIVVQFGWLEYPVRVLYKANATSFLFEYFILPIIAIFFILKYPNKKQLKIKILYYLMFSSVISLIEYFVEKYTLLIKYNSWNWYWTLISVTILFYIIMCIYKWFYKIKSIFSI
jgi:hypothetical protein